MANHDPPQFFLIDGYALIYRAFFAMIARPLKTSRGENTSAAWGVANFLLRLREKYRPDYLAWVNDAGDSFRTEVYPEYKSTREKLDDELQADFDRSVEHIRELLEAFRVPLVALEGYEADDVIGCLAREGAGRGWQVVIVSGDKDFYQLIGPRVALLNPGRGGPAGVDEQWVDESNAVERLGVPPSQVADYLALVGDSSDNVPGVKGIGAKGAVTLLREYGDLEQLLAHAAEIKGKRPREALLAQGDAARLSRRLVTIQCDLPVGVELDTLAVQPPDQTAAARVLSELEFYTLVPQVGLQEAEPAPVVAGQPEPRVITDPAELFGLAARLRQAPVVALKTEGSAPDPREADLLGLSLAVSPGESWYLPFGHRQPGELLDSGATLLNLPPLGTAACRPVAEVLRDAAVPKAGHDLKYDWQVLRGQGVELAGASYDALLASFVLDPGRRSHTIDTLSLDHLGRPIRSLSDVIGRGRSQVPFAELPVTDAAAYGCACAATVLALREHFAQPLRQQELLPLLEEIELPLIEVLVDMEWAGIAIDRDFFQRLSGELADDLRRLERRILEVAGGECNLNSPRQLAALLFERLQLPVVKKTKTGPSTDADVLQQLAGMGHEIPQLILDYRELEKLRSTYVDVLPSRVNPRTGRIHTSFNQTGAATGRLSSSEPNLQNIPVRSERGGAIRRGFVAAPGCRFVVADYSQIELRLIAHLSEDPAFIEAFRRGGDIHVQTAAVIFSVPAEQVTPQMRAQAKTINFATIYGQGPFALSRQLGISMEEARAFIAQYFERFAGVHAYRERMVHLARERGYVETIFGRRRYIPEVRDRNFNVRAFGERTAANSPVQGSAADLIKIAMRNIHQALKGIPGGGRMLLQVHDELLFESPEAEASALAELVTRHMQEAVALRVPLVVEVGIGPNWLEAKH